MEKKLVTASSYELMKQAAETACYYYGSIAASLDKTYGKGWSAQHPEVIARLSEVAAIDFGTALLVKVIEKTGEEVVETLGFQDR